MKQRDVKLYQNQRDYGYNILDKDDQALFDEQVKVIQDNFVYKNHIVLWKLSERRGQSATNALIDDLRIIEQLYRAYEMYKEERYKTLPID